MEKPSPDFENLYGENVDVVYRYCLRMIGSRTDAEDLCQETFLEALKGFRGFQGRSAARTWLLGIARHRTLKLLRRRRLERLWKPQASDSNMTQLLALEQAILALPASLRESFILVKVEGLTCQEAAAIEHVAVGTVKSRIHDAVMLLRNSLTGAFHGEEVTHVS